jgi:MATE family multidrug resistance protein
MALLWLNMGPILVALEQDPTISAPAIAYTRFALPDLVASEEKILFRKGITGV